MICSHFEYTVRNFVRNTVRILTMIDRFWPFVLTLLLCVVTPDLWAQEIPLTNRAGSGNQNNPVHQNGWGNQNSSDQSAFPSQSTTTPSSQSTLAPSLPNRLVKKAVLPKHTTVAELENGLVLIIQENTLAPQVSVRCFVAQTGSAYETDYYGCGLTAQLLQQIAKVPLFGSVSKETLSFGIDGMSELWKSLIQQLAVAVFQSSDQRFGTVDKTATFSGHPAPSLDDLIDQMIYSELPQKAPLSGYPDLLIQSTTEMVRDYAKKHLQPHKMVWVICGKIPTEEVLESCCQLLGSLPKGTREPVTSFCEMEQLSPRSFVVEEDRNSTELALIWPGTRFSDSDRFALELLALLLSEGQTSRLARRLNTDRPIALEWSSICESPLHFNGYFAVKAVALPDYHETVTRTILEEVYRFCEEPVAQEELQKAKKQKEAASVFSVQTIAQSAEQLGRNYLATGDPLFEETALQRIRNVTPTDIQRVARTFFRPEKLNQVSRIPRNRGLVGTSHISSEPGNEIQRFTLPNGIRLLAKKELHRPFINIQAVILGGDLLDTAENQGRASLFAAMLNQGSAKYTVRDLAESLEKRGATLTFSAERGMIVANMMLLSEDFQQGVDLLADCLIAPTFPDAPLTQSKARQLDELLRSQDDPIAELGAFFSQNLPDTTPYHLSLRGSTESVRKLTVASLREYYQRSVIPSNIILTVFGHVDPKEAEKVMTSAFGKMRGTTPNKPIVLDRNNLFLQPIEGHLPTSKKSAAIMIGYPIGNPSNMRETAVFMLLQQLIGGGKQGTGTNDEKRAGRENRTGGDWLSRDLLGTGLAQTAGCQLWTGPTPGYFVLYAVCSPAQLNATRSSLERCMERIQSGLIDPDELLAAKSQVITAYMSGNSTLEEQAKEAAQNELLGYELLGGPTLPDRINALTLEEVVSIARKYLTRRILTTAGPR